MRENASKSTFWRTCLIGAVLTALAVAIRWPYINLVPCWSAGNENNLALAILNGARPLTNQNPHLGALSPYIVALFLRIFGFHSLVPRLVPFLFGIATILFTWRLGHHTGSSRTGIVAATLMSAAWYHVVFSSHYPWSNSLTPFFAVTFLLILSHVQNSTKPIFLSVLAGLIFGMGMQTHPEMVTLIPVIVLVLVLQHKHALNWLKQPVPWLMIVGGAVGYGNMLYYNIVNRFQSVEFGLTYPEYALTKEYTATSITSNYIHEFLYLPRIFLGLHNDAISWSSYAAHPMIWLFWSLVIAGMVITVRQHRFIVPAAFLSSFLIIPAINSNYSLNLGRYLVFMFPPAVILAAETMNALLSLKQSKIPVQLIRWSTMIILILIFLFPVAQIQSYYEFCSSNGLTRERFHRLDTLISQSGLKNPLIILDQETGEGDDFNQYLLEEGYRVAYVKVRDNRGRFNGEQTLREEIAKTSTARDIDGTILVLAPWTRYEVLGRFPIRRMLGQIDIRFQDDFVDFYRVYLL